MPKPSKKAAEIAKRDVIYPEVIVSEARGDKAMTAQQVRDLLGWEEETDQIKLTECVSELTPLFGKKIRLTNNTANRYVTPSWLLTLKQEHLNRRWRFNGESIVIGETGQVLSGQHRLISFLLAVHEWLFGDEKDHWRKLWPEEPTFESIVVFGVKEDDDTFKTLNCGKPGTLAEVLYRSEYFANMKPDARKIASRMTDQAIKVLWHRTGAGLNAFTPRRTHAEAMDFIARHQRLLKAVKHIMEENQEQSIGKIVPPGIAAGLMYLMAASSTDPTKYRASEHPNEKLLDFKDWDLSEEFWTLISGGSVKMMEIKHAIAGLFDAEDGSGGGTINERVAIMCKGWNEFNGGALTAANLALEYRFDGEGNKYLDECPTVGGIDMGDPEDAEKKDAEEDAEESAAEPTPEEIEEATKKAIEDRDKADAERERKKAELLANRKKTQGKPPAPNMLPKPANKRDEPAEDTAPAEATPHLTETPAPTPVIKPRPKKVARKSA